MQDKIEQHERFWRGQGPCLIQIPAGEQPLYDLDDYPARFRDPEAMWRSEMTRTRGLTDWPTDGIPTVRPNLGVIFVPSVAGLPYELPDGQMPWPGKHLTREEIRSAQAATVEDAELMQRTAHFYRIHQERDGAQIAAYQADTQGVLDIAHLLYGDRLFYEFADPDEHAWIAELLAISRDLYVRTTRALKRLLDEPPHAMIHGHGTSQGIYLPHAGTRMAEDTATLLSPDMIERFLMPAIQDAAEPFGGVFFHYCGTHPELLRLLCSLPCARAIDLGNPEQHDLRAVLACCAETRTVLWSRVAAEPGEDWETYVRRVAGMVRETGARCILRPTVFPQTREACADMRAIWHHLTTGDV